GLILVLTSVALGGVAWLRVVLRAEPHVKPDAPTALALRAIGIAAATAALAQAAILVVSLGAIADAHGAWPLAAFVETTFALTATARVLLAATVAVLASIMAHRAASGALWNALSVSAVLLAASSAVVRARQPCRRACRMARAARRAGCRAPGGRCAVGRRPGAPRPVRDRERAVGSAERSDGRAPILDACLLVDGGHRGRRARADGGLRRRSGRVRRHRVWRDGRE